MIVGQDGRLVIGNLGWVDKGQLWSFDAITGTQRYYPIAAKAGGLDVRAGSQGHFRLGYIDDDATHLSVRSLDEPLRALASLRIDGSGYRFAGNSAMWNHTELSALLRHGPQPRLIQIDPARERIIE